jgi:hypothetical protein
LTNPGLRGGRGREGEQVQENEHSFGTIVHKNIILSATFKNVYLIHLIDHVIFEIINYNY